MLHPRSSAGSQNLFPQSNGFGCNFHELVRLYHRDGIFQVDSAGRFEPIQEIQILTFLPNICQLFHFDSVHLDVSLQLVLSDDHAFVAGLVDLDVEVALVFEFSQSVLGCLPCASDMDDGALFVFLYGASVFLVAYVSLGHLGLASGILNESVFKSDKSS